MSMITLFSAFMGLYVIVRLILPSGMNWSLKLILSLFAFACAEKLLLTKLVYGTMGAFMPEPVQLASGYLHSAVTILFLLLVVRDALLLLTWPAVPQGGSAKFSTGIRKRSPHRDSGPSRWCCSRWACQATVCGKPCGSLPCVKSVCRSPACRMR